jgi:hypothetical protein
MDPPKVAERITPSGDVLHAGHSAGRAREWENLPASDELVVGR